MFSYFAMAVMLFVCAATGMGAVHADAESDSEAPERFVQDRFVVGMFGDPPLTEDHYRGIADAHFNLVVGGLHADTLDKVREQIALCDMFGLKLIAICRDASSEEVPVATSSDIPPDQYPEGDAVWGYAVQDEPSAKAFANLARKAEAIRQARPGRLPLTNLLGNYILLDWEGLGADHYYDYLEKYVEAVHPEVLSMDYYPFFVPGSDDRDGLCAALEPMRRTALKYDIPFWNFFNAMPYGMQTDPTESQMRWQVFTSLAYGSKGVCYFCYFTPPGDEFPKGGAVMSRDGRRTRHWDQAQRINEQVMNLGPTLMQLTSTGAFRIMEPGHVDRFLKGSGIKAIGHDPVDPSLDYLIGTFKHADGRRAVLFNNYRFAYTAWPTVEFDVPAEQVREVDKWSGKEILVVDDSPDMEGLQLSLDAGEGRLFLLPPGEG